LPVSVGQRFVDLEIEADKSLEIINYLECTYEFDRIARNLGDYQFTVLLDFHLRNRKANLCVLARCELRRAKNGLDSLQGE